MRGAPMPPCRRGVALAPRGGAGDGGPHSTAIALLPRTNSDFKGEAGGCLSGEGSERRWLGAGPHGHLPASSSPSLRRATKDPQDPGPFQGVEKDEMSAGMKGVALTQLPMHPGSGPVLPSGGSRMARSGLGVLCGRRPEAGGVLGWRSPAMFFLSRKLLQKNIT